MQAGQMWLEMILAKLIIAHLVDSRVAGHEQATFCQFYSWLILSLTLGLRWKLCLDNYN